MKDKIVFAIIFITFIVSGMWMALIYTSLIVLI